MTTVTNDAKVPLWLWLAGGLGVLWNAYGLYQFIGSFSQTEASLMAGGMTASQAELYLSLPAWIAVAFGVGVLGGLIGSVALLLRRAQAVTILGVALVGYVFLFSGDVYYGVFANIPSQLAILTVVVLVAAALLAVSIHARKRKLLTG